MQNTLLELGTFNMFNRNVWCKFNKLRMCYYVYLIFVGMARMWCLSSVGTGPCAMVRCRCGLKVCSAGRVRGNPQ